MAASVSSASAGMMTPLPAASPESFTTTGTPNSRAHALAAAVSVKAAQRGPGRPRPVVNSRAHAFDDSMRAHARVGPKTAMPFVVRRSARPSASGASGPMMTRSALAVSGSASSASTLWPRWAHAQRSADSRPPEPTTSTFMGRPSCERTLEGQLALRLVDRHWVHTGEAGVAVAVGTAHGTHHPLEREEPQRVRADAGCHLLDGEARGHQVAVVAHV